MARTITQIQNLMLTDIASNDTLSASLNSSSKYAFYRLITFIVATAIWIHESFFDQHTIENNTLIYNQRSGRPSWYREMALRFQYGFDLVQDKDYYNNETATDAEIEESKIIKYAAVTEAEDESRIVIKIAGEVGGVLADFTDPAQVEAIRAYFKEIKHPGKITIINYKADKLYLNIQIKRDALVLDKYGMNREAKYPVNIAIQEFMKELPFDGDLRLSALVDKMQKVPGVLDATILSAESSWIDPNLDGYALPQPITISKVAVSGYFEIVTFDTIDYVV